MPGFTIWANKRCPMLLWSASIASCQEWDARWISLEGVVRSVRRPAEITAYANEAAFGSTNLIITLASGPDLIDVITIAPGAVDDRSLIDARVRLHVAVASPPIQVGGSEISVTTSIGATVAPDCGRTQSEILGLADLAFYQAKSAGRNCVVFRSSSQQQFAETM
jgi:hypothetical protein